MKYSKEDVLEIIKVNHRQRIQIEIGFLTEEEISFELTIRDWIDEMELLNWKKLSKYYCDVFEISEYEYEFRNSMLPIKKKTIEDICEFISDKSIKPKIESVKLFGRECEKAGIFKHLKRRLREENEPKSKEIKPSSKLEDFMNDFAFKIVEEVNKINPNILPLIRYEPNELEKQDWKIFLSGTISLILGSFIQNWLIGGIGLGLIISGIWMSRIAFKMKSHKFEFEGLETFRDLVVLIEENNHGMQQSSERT